MTKTKNKKLFTIKNNKNKINMEVNESNFNHFQSLTPMQQKAVQDLMMLKFLQEMYD
jgi:hypothetical protein